MCRLRIEVLVIAILVGAAAEVDAGQLSSLISPGQLSRAHAALEGADKCLQCHEAGQKVTPRRCLTCHKPIEERIAKKVGVHRNVTGDCVSCHAEHNGLDVDLRRIDTRRFNHATETGFTLEGFHTRATVACASCHKTRSYLQARPACSSCHADVHKGGLGADCTRCHSTATAFKAARAGFDHTTTRFALTGSHTAVACEKCHVGGRFRGLNFDGCAACHQAPHRKTLAASCTACHTTQAWTTRTIEHSRTAFPLVGKHRDVTCEKCHTSGITKPVKFSSCASCHVNVHRNSIQGDCKSCHTEDGFAKAAPFDHATKTSFPLVGKHDGVACVKCHTSTAAAVSMPLARRVVDFGGTSAQCAGCHKDPHKSEYGSTCDRCHTPAQFAVAGFRHQKQPAFFGGQHAPVACAKCHVPSPTKKPAMDCVSCHEDVHLGQVGAMCERCHTTDAGHFAPAAFAHDRTSFSLTGKHRALECVQCHPKETRAYPSRAGSAVRLVPTATDCASCHKDPHLGQVDARCATCHTTTAFTLLTYAHPGNERLFNGIHAQVACRACHKRETGSFPKGSGTAIRLKVGASCATCHRM